MCFPLVFCPGYLHLNSFYVHIYICTLEHFFSSRTLCLSFSKGLLRFLSLPLLLYPILPDPSASCSIISCEPSTRVHCISPPLKAAPHGLLVMFWYLWIFQMKLTYLKTQNVYPQMRENIGSLFSWVEVTSQNDRFWHHSYTYGFHNFTLLHS